MGAPTVLSIAMKGRSISGLALCLVILCICVSTVQIEASYISDPLCPTGFANFGDSLTDTGNILDAFPFLTNVENLPYGETYFGKPAKRFSNGRLVVDFFSLAFHYHLLDPYFKVTTYDYKNGINFAQGGATSVPIVGSANPFSLVPFQLNQFRRFAGSVAETQANAANCGTFLPLLPTEGSYLSNWLYTIQIGGNDIFAMNFTTPDGIQAIINTTVPTIVGAIALGIQQLYAGGARNFLIFGIPTTESAIGDVILTTFNTEMLVTIGGLRTALNGSHIAYFDYFAAYQEIYTHPAKYGFKNLLPDICCGTYVPLAPRFNFSALLCGVPGIKSCPNPDEYVYWDGVHFTEAFYREISKFALTGQFTDGGVDYSAICKLDFSQFGPEATYQETYPTTCDSIFS